MTEPRARAVHRQGQQNFAKELPMFMFGYGDDRQPLPESVKVLDEIVTDYIIELCHEAGAHATYQRRAKANLEDFKFALRKDPQKLARMEELRAKDSELAKTRQLISMEVAQTEGLTKEAVKEARKEATREEKQRLTVDEPKRKK